MTETTPAVDQEDTPVLRMDGIEKRFGGVQALRGVDFELRAGQIHALLGENGAGKSTLIRMIAGAHQPDGGTITLDGRRVRLRTPHAARQQGVAVVYQETSLCPDLSVLENLYLGRWTRRRGLVDWAGMRREAAGLFDRLGMKADLSAQLSDVSKAVAQQVEIARAMLQGARILILDEPGSVLNDDEMHRLQQMLRESRDNGVAVVYITHRLEEVMRLADRVTVMRDGRTVATDDIGKIDEGWIIRQMVGRDVHGLYARHQQQPGEAVLEVRNLSLGQALSDVDVTVRAGEIVGVAGLVGSGRNELATCIAGLDTPTSGEIRVGGEVVRTPWQAQRAGLGYVPGDRKRQGIFATRSLTANATITTLSRHVRGWFVDRRSQAAATDQVIEQLRVRPPRRELAIGALSGGNQQKVLLGKVLATNPRALVLEEPTTGVDIGAKQEIHALIDELVTSGIGVLLSSSDLPELLGMADRVLVMREGQIVGEAPRGSSSEDVMALAFHGTARKGSADAH